MRRRSCLGLCASGALALVAASCFLPPSARAQPTPVTVAVGGKTIFGYVDLPLAQYLGYFKDEGLAVEIDDVASGPKAVEALVGGSADFVYGAIDYTFLLQPKGIDIVSLFIGDDLGGIVLGLPPDRARAYTGPADLKGLSFGMTGPGGAAENMLRIILAKGGLSLSDVTVVGVGFGPSAVLAMKTHKVDAMVIADPVMLRLTLDGDLVPVVDTRTVAGQTYVYGGPAALAGATARLDYIKAHRATVQAFVTALVRAAKWLHRASVDEIMGVLPQEFYGGDRALYAQVMTSNRKGFTPDGRTNPAEMQVSYEQVLATGRLAPTDKIDIARIFDQEFVEKANR